jgi:CO/xanthine dehydrogenase FAD-binding subunit
MISYYHRPSTLDQALVLLAQPDTVPLGGGTWINSPGFDRSGAIAVVDLQDLGLARMSAAGQTLEIGASVTLQQMLDAPETPAPLKRALHQEAAANLRNMATAAGTLVACDGRSPFATILLALDAKLTLASRNGTDAVGLGELLALRSELLSHKLITQISLPLNAALAWESVSRTPADKPIVSAALARWPGGRLRLAVGGFGPAPLLGLDAADPAGIESAARNALHDATDPWGSAEYRMEVAAILARRCLAALDTESAHTH